MKDPGGRQLTAEQFALVRDLFNRAHPLPKSQRRALIDEACGDDLVLRHAAEELLAASDVQATPFEPREGGMVRQTLEADGIISDAPPEYIGPYKIVRELGRGGMGLVYLATQPEPAREVAIKILGSGAVGSRSELQRQRFAREIQLLGRLEHPGIARIYDAGTARTATGEVSYFAMECVRGPRLTEYASSRALSIAARVELMALWPMRCSMPTPEESFIETSSPPMFLLPKSRWARGTPRPSPRSLTLE